MKWLGKNIVFAMFAMLMMMTTCMAAGPSDGEIPEADMALGGITLGASESYVRSIYGEPADVSYDSNGGDGRFKICQYGSSLFVKIAQGSVIEVKSTANNGLKTPQGFTVGMPLSKVEKYYGNKGYASTENGKKTRRYQANWYKFIAYQADKKGNIESIHLYRII